MNYIKTGQTVIVSEGEWSDYSILFIVRALVDVDVIALKEEWLSLHPEQREEYHFESYQFFAWVMSQGIFTPVSVDWLEWHIASYGNLEFEDLHIWRSKEEEG
jgi:hypothetical protein